MWTIQIAGIVVGNLKTLVFPKAEETPLAYMGAWRAHCRNQKAVTLTQERARFYPIFF